METLTVICAWCPDFKAKTLAAMRRGERVTHSLCPSCASELERELSTLESSSTDGPGSGGTPDSGSPTSSGS